MFTCELQQYEQNTKNIVVCATASSTFISHMLNAKCNLTANTKFWHKHTRSFAKHKVTATANSPKAQWLVTRNLLHCTETVQTQACITQFRSAACMQCNTGTVVCQDARTILRFFALQMGHIALMGVNLKWRSRLLHVKFHPKRCKGAGIAPTNTFEGKVSVVQSMTMTSPSRCLNSKQQQQPFNGRLSGTTRVGRYQKKHSPAHTHPGQRTSFITFLH